MMRVPAYFVSVSLHTYQLRSGEPFGAVRARWNHGCWSDVWLMTSSVRTRMFIRRASSVNRWKSSSVPYIGFTDV